MNAPAVHLELLSSRLMSVGSDEQQLARLARRLLLAIALLVAVSAGYYVYDHYFVRVASPLDQATRTLEDQVWQAPNDPSLRIQVAQAYVRQGRIDDGIEQYQQALALKANWQPALLGLADAEVRRHHEPAAESIYRQIADLNKDNDLRHANTDLQEVYYRLSTFAAQAGRHQEAIQWATEALAVDLTAADALFLLGTSHEALGEMDEAADAYRRAVSFDPGFGDAFSALERIALARGDRAEATYAHAMALLAGGDVEGAIAGLRRIVDGSPDNAEAYEGLGLAYAKQGQRAAAIDAFRAALDRKPGLLLAEWSLRSLGAEK
jgi:tetratricopeptide (TPR) repeat protein